MQREADRDVGQGEPARDQEVAASSRCSSGPSRAAKVSRASARIASVAAPGVLSRSTREIMPIGSMIVDSPYHSHCRNGARSGSSGAHQQRGVAMLG